MPKVSNNNDPLLERAIFAFDGTNYRVVSVDTSGQLVAALASGSTVKVTQDTAANLLATVNLATDQNVQARAHGYDGSNWRKLQQLWGYTAQWAEQVKNLNAAAGNNTLSTAAVATDYVATAQQISVRNAVSNPALVFIYLTIDAVDQYFLYQAAPGANVIVRLPGPFTLKAGDKINVLFTGCTLNDDLYLDVNGYKMKIND